VVVGFDGTRGGWIGIALGDDGHLAGEVSLGLDTGFAEVAAAGVIAVDVPIGFGPRAADAAARRLLGAARGRSVFAVPSEAVLVAALNEKTFRAGLGLSAQLYRIAPRIAAMTALAERRTLYEVHPELSFQAMNGGQPLRYQKKTYGGVEERRELLAANGIVLDRLSGAARSAPIDDVLDAAAAAWTALRIDRREARSLPDPPERRGSLRVAIWY
jgi:predicted RNase H-like nuclease